MIHQTLRKPLYAHPYRHPSHCTDCAKIAFHPVDPRKQAYDSEYYQQHRDRLLKRKAYRRKHDLDCRLAAVLRGIVERCTDPMSVRWKYYGGKGVRNFLTVDDLKALWERDRAADMKRPSIDRSDSTGDYTFANCAFIELAYNVRREHAARRQKRENGNMMATERPRLL